MTGGDSPANPSVLNTTVLSNFAYIDQLWVVAGLSGICTVPVVREEPEHGIDNHPYLQEALDTLDDEIPVATISDTVANGSIESTDGVGTSRQNVGSEAGEYSCAKGPLPLR
ncbi:hypothetical protein ACFO0H_16555, partial [Haloarchaeobius iranensis]|uniref:hypothetical protein n=1 Tax=Haloarchaeobius iranensis TaxID=996166 RepID=UPI0036184B00